MTRHHHWKRKQARLGNVFSNNSMILTFNIMGQNRTFRAFVDQIPRKETPYDAEGATIYVVAVIVIYGVSIILLILATVRGRRQFRHLDQQISSYFKDVERIRKKAAAKTLINQSQVLASGGAQTRPDSSTSHLPLIVESSEPSPDPGDSCHFFPNDDPTSAASSPALSRSIQFRDTDRIPRRQPWERGILKYSRAFDESFSAGSSPSLSGSIPFRTDTDIDRRDFDRGVLTYHLGRHLQSGLIEDTASAPNSPALTRVLFKPLGQQLGKGPSKQPKDRKLEALKSGE